MQVSDQPPDNPGEVIDVSTPSPPPERNKGDQLAGAKRHPELTNDQEEPQVTGTPKRRWTDAGGTTKDTTMATVLEEDDEEESEMDEPGFQEKQEDPQTYEETTEEPLTFAEMYLYMHGELAGKELQDAKETVSVMEYVRSMFKTVFKTHPTQSLAESKRHYPELTDEETDQLLRLFLMDIAVGRADTRKWRARLYDIVRSVYKTRRSMMDIVDHRIATSQAAVAPVVNAWTQQNEQQKTDNENDMDVDMTGVDNSPYRFLKKYCIHVTAEEIEGLPRQPGTITSFEQLAEYWIDEEEEQSNRETIGVVNQQQVPAIQLLQRELHPTTTTPIRRLGEAPVDNQARWQTVGQQNNRRSDKRTGELIAPRPPPGAPQRNPVTPRKPDRIFENDQKPNEKQQCSSPVAPPAVESPAETIKATLSQRTQKMQTLRGLIAKLIEERRLPSQQQALEAISKLQHEQFEGVKAKGNQVLKVCGLQETSTPRNGNCQYYAVASALLNRDFQDNSKLLQEGPSSTFTPSQSSDIKSSGSVWEEEMSEVQEELDLNQKEHPPDTSGGRFEARITTISSTRARHKELRKQWNALATQWEADTKDKFPTLPATTETWKLVVHKAPGPLLSLLQQYQSPDYILSAMTDAILDQWTVQARLECLVHCLSIMMERATNEGDNAQAKWVEDRIKELQQQAAVNVQELNLHSSELWKQLKQQKYGGLELLKMCRKGRTKYLTRAIVAAHVYASELLQLTGDTNQLQQQTSTIGYLDVLFAVTQDNPKINSTIHQEDTIGLWTKLEEILASRSGPTSDGNDAEGELSPQY
ncbi:hypothetical protein PR002_g21849 [Phytophthora rubi]|uniref:Uncharacterized protein n=1 Tax=Phytophthora rubi TaxID=129364 RepID=A0A6A3J9E9_9STRA|nr:hypothetical protein PR002_g21849 [Phytophthora rubi]